MRRSSQQGFKVTYNGKNLPIASYRLLHDPYGFCTTFQVDGILPTTELSPAHAYCTNEITYKPEREDNMSTVRKIAALTLDEDTKLLRKYDIINDEGFVTEEGSEVLLQVLFDNYKSELVEKLQQLEDAEKPKQIAA